MPKGPDAGGVILLVEDEEDMRFLVRQSLVGAGHEVREAGSVAEARAALAEGPCDLYLLDVGLPDGSGFELLRARRERADYTPALFLTARDAEADRLLGFAVGGDDYVTKPFSMAELLARIGAILKRGRAPRAQRLCAPGLEVDLERYRVRRGRTEHALTYLECELLRYLGARPGEAVSRQELLREVWGYERFPTTRTVDTHVLSLRKKIEPDPKSPRHLLTVHGIGYKLVLS